MIFRALKKTAAGRSRNSYRRETITPESFGYKAAEQFLTIQDWEKFDWLSSFKDAEVTTDVEFILRRTGTIIATEDEKKAGG
jgi:hypothetical protein